MKYYLNAMRKYATFSGRASRSEFWLYGLIVFLMSIVTVIIDGAFGFADEGALVFTGIVSIVHLIPSLSVSVRRLHDTDKSGWWLLLSFIGIGVIVLFVFFCLEPTRGPNRFGAEPDGANNGSHNDGAANGQSPQQNASQAPVAASQAANAPDTLEQLNKLKALHDSDAIDDAEFAKMKADLIGKAG